MVSTIRKLAAVSSAVVGVKSYGEFPTANQMSIIARGYGLMQNDFGVEVLNTVAAGAETVVWSKNKVTINVQGGVSTITQVLTAYTATLNDELRWGTLAAIAAGGTAVAAMPLTAMRYMADGILGVMPAVVIVDLKNEGGREFNTPVLMGGHIGGGPCTFSLEQSDNNFVGLVAYGEQSKIRITSINKGQVYNSYNVTIQATVGLGAEAVAWSKNGVVISTNAASTVAHVLAAAGGITGTPWGVITAASGVATTDVVAAFGIKAISAMTTAYVGGQDIGVLVEPATSTLANAESQSNLAITGVGRYLQVSGFATGSDAQIEFNICAVA